MKQMDFADCSSVIMRLLFFWTRFGMAANGGKVLRVGPTVDVEPPITDEEVLAEESSVGTQHCFSRSRPHTDVKYLFFEMY